MQTKTAAFGELGDRGQSELEAVTLIGHGHLDRGGQRIGVGDGDEDGVGLALGIGHSSVGSTPESRPQPGLDQQCALTCAPVRLAGCLPVKELKAYLLGATGSAFELGPGELDDHGLEDALLTTVDGHHLAGSPAR